MCLSIDALEFVLAWPLVDKVVSVRVNVPGTATIHNDTDAMARVQIIRWEIVVGCRFVSLASRALPRVDEGLADGGKWRGLISAEEGMRYRLATGVAAE